MPTAIVGREHELAAMEAFLAQVEQGPAALVLSGEPGIGKTILWEAGVEEATGRSCRVLSCHGVEAEAAFAFSGLSELVAEVFEELAPSLPPPRRRALEVALLLVDPAEETADAHGIGLAVLDVLKASAEQSPVVVAVDDLQWLDVSSAAVLQIALRRLRAERVGFLATLRTAPDVAAPFDLPRSFPGDRLEPVALGALSLGSLHHLLKEQLGLELTRPELSRVVELSGGNPFFALELGRELVRTKTRPLPGQVLRVPQSLRELVGGRLARLPAETSDVLLQVAALARPTVELVASAHGDREGALAALHRGASEGVVQLEESRVRFSHPLLASICYEEVPPWKRRAVHAALARVVTDLEERARHLALATDGADSAVADELETAAEQASARGATTAGAELFELAARRTPDDPVLERRRRFRAATSYRLAGYGEQAADMLERLLSEVPSGPERADILLALVMTLRADSPTMIAYCDEALIEAGGDDARAARILAYRSQNRVMHQNVAAALVDMRAMLDKAERVGDPALIAAAIARVGAGERYAGEIDRDLLERGAEIEERLDLPLEYFDSPRFALARQLMYLGEQERSRRILEDLQARAAARGDEGTRVMALWVLSTLEWLAGQWPRALGYAEAAQELTEKTQYSHAGAWAGRAKALVEVDLGLASQARASAEGALSLSKAASNELYAILSLGTLGRLELALGNMEAAGHHLRVLPGRLHSRGINDPTNFIWADAIETLIALAEPQRAREYLEAYELHAQRLGSPWAVAAAARCRGLLCAAEGEADGAFSAFERALEQLQARPFPLERARTLLCLGTVRRQAGQKRPAREALEQALDIFEELGARLWAEKARAELKRISGRRAVSEELTETELRVAELAAQGRSNKQIAAELFMGVSTVEMHLSRVYRKLGVRRAALARKLVETADQI